MVDYPNWPEQLCGYINQMRNGYNKVNDIITQLTEEFNVSDEGYRLFLHWCNEYDVSKVCYDLRDLYEKKDDYKGKSLNIVARSFFRQPTKTDIPVITQTYSNFSILPNYSHINEQQL